jgi:hypothetical protein
MVPSIVDEALRECPIERAVYHLAMAPGFTAGFVRQDPRKAERYDLLFRLNTPKRAYHFSFSEPDFYEGPYIRPAIDPKRAAAMEDYQLDFEMEQLPDLAIEFDTFSPELYNWRVPVSFNPPPALLFSRGLSRELRRDARALAGGDWRAEEEDMPIGLFVLAECAPAAH